VATCGFIKSIDDPITNYLPELKGQGFESIMIKNLLTMGSGIRYRGVGAAGDFIHLNWLRSPPNRCSPRSAAPQTPPSRATVRGPV